MEVDWIILADGAEVINNKLYLLGGGWDALTVNSGFPAQHDCAIAIAFRIPWSETNQRHPVEVEILGEDGHSLARIDAQIEVSRPPGNPPGQAQRVQLALSVGLSLVHPGIYFVVVRARGEEVRRVPFDVVPGRTGGHAVSRDHS